VAEEVAKAVENSKPRLPLWMANLFVFAFLFCAVMAYFLWQVQQARKDFLKHVREHAVLVAEVVQLSARGSVLARRSAEEILEAFLGNTARFVDYLDKVEPFTQEELTAFSQEAGLMGIRIERARKKYVEGPSGWLQKTPSDCMPTPKIEHLEGKHLYLFSLGREGGTGCVTVGISDVQIRAMQEHLGLENVIKTIAGIPRMSYVTLEKHSTGKKGIPGEPAVTMIDNGNIRVAEARMPMEGKELIVALDAEHLYRSTGRMWRNFFVFSAALASLGVVLSFILYRYQAGHLTQVTQFERRISKEREDASLGRAAAGIAHEIRNPLNALGIGLQRLQLEGDELRDEHRRLVSLMMDAVHRTNNSVKSLLNYARPQKPNRKPTRVDLLLERTLALYSSRCEDLHIKVTQEFHFKEIISADPGLLGQVIENLLRNAIEAQPDGGFIHAEVGQKKREVYLTIKNGGSTLSTEETDRIFEPYFTTKTEGTGLGLTISQRIIQAHGGRLEAHTPEAGIVIIDFYLPLTGYAE